MKPIELTLKKAIEQSVKFFTDNNGEFSIYTITSIIRSDVNSLKYTIEGYDPSDTHSGIWHQDVKDSFEEIQDDLDVKFLRNHTDSTHDVTYRVFGSNGGIANGAHAFGQSLSATSMSIVNTPDTKSSDSSTSVGGDPSVVNKQIASVNNPFSKLKINPSKVSVSTTDSKTDNILRMRNYLQRNGSATLKKIQSCLKQKGITCKNILSDLQSQSDISITPATNLSEYLVKID